MEDSTTTDIFLLIILVLVLGFVIYSAIYTAYFATSEEETHLQKLNYSDLIFSNKTLKVNGPDNKPIEILTNENILDLTNNNTIYIKFVRDKPNGLYKGSDWRYDGIVKLPKGILE